MTTRNIEQQVRGALGGNEEYVAERTAWVKAQREVTELKLAAMKGELAPLPAVGVAIGAVASAVRQNTFSVPSSVAQRCVGKPAEEIHQIIASALRHAFEPFDAHRISEIIRSSCAEFDGPAGGGPETPAEADNKSVGRRRKDPKPRVKRKAGKVDHS